MNAIRSLPIAATALILIAIVAIVLLCVAVNWLLNEFPLPSNPTVRVQYLEQYIHLAQLIGVGFVVTLLSAIIPLLLLETRDRFEQYKESRQAYSRAKTAVLYLPDRVLDVDREKAFLLVEEAHRELHFAETFEEVIINKGYLAWFDNPALWVLYNYWQIVAVAEVLRSCTTDSGVNESKDEFRDRLHRTLAVVHKRFGTRGQNCKGEKWDLKDGSRFRKEDELKERVNEIAHSRVG